VMNHYFTLMSGPIRAQRGVIDKYIGDAIMSYWGPPFVEDAEQAMLACLAATEMVELVPALQQQLPDLLGIRAMPAPCDLRIGIATGEVLTGSIGSELMMSFTVMGDAVNLASRLEAANKVYGTRILIAEATAAALGSNFELREIDRVAVAGQSVPHPVFDVMGKAGALTEAQAALRAHYAEGLAAYRARRFDDARKAFTAALESVPGDGPSKTLLARIDQWQVEPPPADWDGAWYMTQK
jgi:class 3 adenylate cyclase